MRSSRNPHLRRPGPEDISFAPVSSRKIKSYTLQTTEGKPLTCSGQHPGRKPGNCWTEYLLAEHASLSGWRKWTGCFGNSSRKSMSAGTAGVFYSDKSARTRTRAGILPTSSAYKTPVCSLDLTHSLQLQGWADYDWLTLPTISTRAFTGCCACCLRPQVYKSAFTWKSGKISLKRAVHRPEAADIADRRHAVCHFQPRLAASLPAMGKKENVWTVKTWKRLAGRTTRRRMRN